MVKNNKTRIFLNSGYNGDYVTTSDGHIFYKEDAKVVNKPKPVFLEDVKNDEVENLLSQNILVGEGDGKSSIGKSESTNTIIDDKPRKGVKEKVSKKSKKDNEEIIDDLIDEE